jgi:TPR repeat protein
MFDQNDASSKGLLDLELPLDSTSNDVQFLLNSALNVIEQTTDSLWARLYNNRLPPAISMPTFNEIPNFYKNYPNIIIKEARDFYLRNIKENKSPMNYFYLGQYQEYIIDAGKLSCDALEIYKKGSVINEPFCMTKIGEILIRDNSQKNRQKAMLHFLRSFILTSVEPYKFLNPRMMINHSRNSDSKKDFFNMDSFWYLCYYFDNYEDEFLVELEKAIRMEKCTDKFRECIIYIFRNLHKSEEHVNIIKMLEEALRNYDKKAGFHFCVFSFLFNKFAGLNINLEYVISVLRFLADDGNYFACEKLALYLDSQKDYSGAMTYFLKATDFNLSTSYEYAGSYFCSYKNPLKLIDLKTSGDMWKKASYLGLCSSIEYLKLLEINKEKERHFVLSEFYYTCELFGSELIIGECFEKGKGTNKNLKMAQIFYKKGLKKHSEGSGFLYRLARLYDKEGKKAVSEDFYKICFIIYSKLYVKDKANPNNMWILDAYRLASLYASGRGVKKDLYKSLYFIDSILAANMNPETSAYVCLYYHTLATKKKIMIERDLKENISSILSLSSILGTMNLQGEDGVFLEAKRRDEDGIVRGISQIENINSSDENSNKNDLIKIGEELRQKNEIELNDSIRVMINTRVDSILNRNCLSNIKNQGKTQIKFTNEKLKEQEVLIQCPNENSVNNENKLNLLKSNHDNNTRCHQQSEVKNNLNTTKSSLKVNKNLSNSMLVSELPVNFELSNTKPFTNKSTQSEEDLLITQVLENCSKLFKNNTELNDFILIKNCIDKIKENNIEIIDINKLVFDELIASGGYSKVFSGWYSNTKVAIKDFQNINENTVKKIFEEICLQTSLCCDKINKVLCLAFDYSPLKICCVNKFMPFNLRIVLERSKLDMIQKCYLAKQLVEAVDFLHQQNPPIVHRDLKPENILLNEDFELQLCDFGIFKILNADKTKSETLNQFYTVRYSPPEVINNSHFICKASDIWSLGLILYDIYYGTQPWTELSGEQIIESIKKERPFQVKKLEGVPSQITSLVKLCTYYDYSKRPKASEILKYIVDMIYELKLV